MIENFFGDYPARPSLCTFFEENAQQITWRKEILSDWGDWKLIIYGVHSTQQQSKWLKSRNELSCTSLSWLRRTNPGLWRMANTKPFGTVSLKKIRVGFDIVSISHGCTCKYLPKSNFRFSVNFMFHFSPILWPSKEKPEDTFQFHLLFLVYIWY